MATSNKLTVSDVIDIRRAAFTLDATTAQLAESFNVTQRTIQRILNGQIWGSVPHDQRLDFGNYEVTADGRIWSINKKAYVAFNSNGNVRLTVHGKKITVNVNELVAENFA